MSMGENIRWYRERRGLTQDNLAEMVGVSFQAVSSWERDEYYPSLDKLRLITEALDVSASAIVEDRTEHFETKEAIYQWKHMKTFIKTSARNFGLRETLEAVDYAEQAHREQKRKNSDIPYIYHPLNIACHALALGIRKDEVIASCLLHDVIEDCGKTGDELPFSERTKELVVLLTHEKVSDDKRDGLMKDYFGKLKKDPDAAFVKCLDRCNNLTTMSWGLSRERIYRMILETKKYFPALIAVLKNTLEYNDAAWLLQYQMESTLDIYSRLM